MDGNGGVSRRRFVGGVGAAGAAAALGYFGLRSRTSLFSQETAGMATQLPATSSAALDEYDSFAKLNFNENPYGPSESMMSAMNHAFKYSNRYGYPDADVQDVIAEHHGVDPDHVLLGAGSGEILEVVGLTFLAGGKKVIGVDPSYGSVYSHATSIRAEAITVPLLSDYRQDIPAVIKATRDNYRDAGFVYICNPNNPTGRIVPKREIRELLDGIPQDIPVLIDEAYHHFVEDRDYATSVSHAIEGRPVVVARTFSKISGLAGMRLGYAVAPPSLIQKMRPYSTGSINALVKWAGAAAMRDVASQEQVKKVTLELRKKTVADLHALGYDVIPSETNFFMVNLKRPVQQVIPEFRAKGVLVGRPFPPMLEHLRVSVGTEEEMGRFMTAFREVMAKKVVT